MCLRIHSSLTAVNPLIKKGQSFMCLITGSWKSPVVFNVVTLVLMTRLLTKMSVLFYVLVFIPFVFFLKAARVTGVRTPPSPD